MSDVRAFHLSDGTLLIGEVESEDSQRFGVANAFTLTKMRMPKDWDPTPLPTSGATGGEAIKVVMAKYDSFNHNTNTTVRLYKAGILSEYQVDEKVAELYKQFSLQQQEIIKENPNPNEETMSITDMIKQVLNEKVEKLNEEDKVDFKELRKNTIRINKKDSDNE